MAQGLDANLTRVVKGAPGALRIAVVAALSGGHLLIETSDRQIPSAQAAFAASGLVPRVVSSEDLGATVVVGRFPADA